MPSGLWPSGSVHLIDYKPSAHALTNLDLVAHAQDHFRYGYYFVNSDFRPCYYGVARCINLKKLVYTYQVSTPGNHIATGSNWRASEASETLSGLFN